MKKVSFLFLFSLSLALMSFVDSSNKKVLSNAKVDVKLTEVAKDEADFKCPCLGTVTINKLNAGGIIQIVNPHTGSIHFEAHGPISKQSFQVTIPGKQHHFFKQLTPNVFSDVRFNFCDFDGGWINVNAQNDFEYIPGCS